jgi:NhaP-type Na+/H+ or K+/H+ antiporter
MAVTIMAIGLLVFAGHFLTGLFQRTKIPDVLILMLAGIVLGPILHVVTPEDFGLVGPVFTTLALIVILFEGGIHLSIRELGSAAKDTLLLSLATYAMTCLLITYLVDFLLPVDALTALLIGTILGGTSSAVVVPLLRVLGISELPRTVLMLESALTDVLAVVLSLGIMRALTPGEAVTAGGVMGTVATSFLIAALIGLGGAFIWSAVLPLVRQFPNTVFTTVAYVLILFGLTELLGYSGAIASLTFGIAAANLPSIPERLLGKVLSFRLVGFAEMERTFFAEIVFLVKTFFFVYLGISISFTDLRAVAVGLSLAIVAFVGRIIMSRLILDKRIPRREALHTVALIPKGLAAAVLASLPAQRGLPDGELVQGTVYAVVFFSIVLCAVLVYAIESGRLDGFGSIFFKPFPMTAPPDQPPATTTVPAYDQSLGLPALQTTPIEEPNPVDFDKIPKTGEPSDDRPGDPHQPPNS